MSYVPANLATSAKDRIRLIIGDTAATEILSDTEINYIISLYPGDENRVAIHCVNSIIAKFSQDINYTLGPYSEKLTDRLKQYRRLINDLKDKVAGRGSPWSPQFDNPDPIIFEFDQFSNLECPADTLSEDEDEEE